MGRVAAALSFVIIGLAGGYSVWGARASSLGQSLDTLTVEYDALRAQAGGANQLAVALDALSSRVSEQGSALAQLAQLTGTPALAGSPATGACDEVEVRMQEQLESCLFARAELERAAAAAKAQAAAPPRQGRATVTETIEVPHISEELKKSLAAKKGKNLPPSGIDGFREKSGLEAAADPAKRDSTVPHSTDREVEP